jgi:hypothetical protein
MSAGPRTEADTPCLAFASCPPSRSCWRTAWWPPAAPAATSQAPALRRHLRLRVGGLQPPGAGPPRRPGGVGGGDAGQAARGPDRGTGGRGGAQRGPPRRRSRLPSPTAWAQEVVLAEAGRSDLPGRAATAHDCVGRPVQGGAEIRRDSRTRDARGGGRRARRLPGRRGGAGSGADTLAARQQPPLAGGPRQSCAIGRRRLPTAPAGSGRGATPALSGVHGDLVP